MRYLKYVALLAVLMVPLAYSQAQVGVGVDVGPGYVGAAPVCDYGYYSYYPYACAPYGYYGPSWFSGGIFIGAGPWYHWGGGGWGRGYYGRGGWGYGHGYGYGRGYAGRGYAGRGYAGRGYAGRGYAGRGAVGGFHGGAVRGGNAFHGGGGYHGGGGGFHGGGGSHGGGGGHGGGGHR
ncbi:MAG: hypothetical protein WAO10_19325 [Candidatus Sulfotelmatobacter sp.]